MLTFTNCHCQYNISSPRKDLLIPLFLHAKTSFQSYFSAVKACGKPSCETLFIIIIIFFYRKTASISLLGCQAALTPHRFDAPLKLHCKNFLLLHSERFANVNYSFIVKENCGKTTIWFDVILSMSSCHKFARQNNHWYLHFYVNKYFNILSKSVLRLPFVFSTTRLSSNVMIIAAFFSE